MLVLFLEDYEREASVFVVSDDSFVTVSCVISFDYHCRQSVLFEFAPRLRASLSMELLFCVLQMMLYIIVIIIFTLYSNINFCFFPTSLLPIKDNNKLSFLYCCFILWLDIRKARIRCLSALVKKSPTAVIKSAFVFW